MVHTHHRHALRLPAQAEALPCMRVHIPTGIPHSGHTQPHRQPQHMLPAQYTIERETARLSGYSGHALRLYTMTAPQIHTGHTHHRTAYSGRTDPHRAHRAHPPSDSLQRAHRSTQHRLRLYHGTHTIGHRNGTHSPTDGMCIF